MDFSKAPCIYWSDRTKISFLQRRIIVYSIMYYELDESCLTDAEYNEISKQLAEMMRTCDQSEIEKSTYYYAMYDFEGSTGFDIPARLKASDREYLTELAEKILDMWKRDRRKGGRNAFAKRSGK